MNYDYLEDEYDYEEERRRPPKKKADSSSKASKKSKHKHEYRNIVASYHYSFSPETFYELGDYCPVCGKYRSVRNLPLKIPREFAALPIVKLSDAMGGKINLDCLN